MRVRHVLLLITFTTEKLDEEQSSDQKHKINFDKMLLDVLVEEIDK